MELMVITGLSGAGKSKTAGVLEDLGWYCVDNLPAALIPALARHCLADRGRYSRVLLVSDVRGGQTFEGLYSALEEIRALGCPCRVLFVEADKDVIIHRYQETRRRHPLQTETESLAEVVDRERTLLSDLRDRADLLLNTSHLTHAQLRRTLLHLLGSEEEAAMPITVCSFGYRLGLPEDADLVLDVRFLPNPYYEETLRPLSGLDEPVRSYLRGFRQTLEYLTRLEELLTCTLPLHANEKGESGLTICFGCTGGRHRSVAMAEEAAAIIRKHGYPVHIVHRDLEIEGKREAER